jgi:hypothetical protein
VSKRPGLANGGFLPDEASYDVRLESNALEKGVNTRTYLLFFGAMLLCAFIGVRLYFRRRSPKQGKGGRNAPMGILSPSAPPRHGRSIGSLEQGERAVQMAPLL